MKNSNTIHLKGNTYQIYNTKNPLILYLANRFFKRIKKILQKNDAFHLKGLDLGCGEGHLISYLKKINLIGQITAVDLDEKRLRYARYNYPIADYIKGDAYSLPFKTNSFDYIIATEILEHLPDPFSAMNEIMRVGKANSFYIISVPYEPFFRIGNILRGKYLRRGGRTPAHVNFWRRSEFKLFLNQFLEITTENYISTFPWLIYSARFKNDAQNNIADIYNN